jgi:hypothetical protein
VKAFAVLILVAAAFAGGYWLGQRPNSPDAATLARQGGEHVSAAGRQVGEFVGRAIGSQQAAPSSPSAGQPADNPAQDPQIAARAAGKQPVTINGRTYLIGAE